MMLIEQRVWGACCLLVLSACGVEPAREIVEVPSETFRLVEVAPGVHATVTREGVNPSSFASSLIVHGPEGVLVIDTRQTPASAAELLAQVRAISDEPVRWVVNTHWHYDHVFGNQVFAEAFPGVEIIGHITTPEDMENIARVRLAGDLERYPVLIERWEGWLQSGNGPNGEALTEEETAQVSASLERLRPRLAEYLKVELTPPSSLIEESRTLEIGGHEVRIQHLSAGHTRGDLVVHLPDLGLAAVGDLLEDGRPWFGDGDPAGWANALDQMAGWEVSTWFLAHGGVAESAELFETERRFTRSLVDQVESLRGSAANLEDALRAADFGEFQEYFTGGDSAQVEGFEAWIRESVERAWGSEN